MSEKSSAIVQELRPQIDDAGVAQINDHLDRVSKLIGNTNTYLELLRVRRMEVESMLWMAATWQATEQYLLKNPGKTLWVRHSLQSDGAGDVAHIRDGQLWVGQYYHNDRFPRNRAFFVRKDLSSERT